MKERMKFLPSPWGHRYEMPTQIPCKGGKGWAKGVHRQRKATQIPCKGVKGGQRVSIVRESPPKPHAKG